ncbi:MAG: sigma-70 family RNA polymerase sigma factor [Prevotella sp.]|nr:sigma-70 family RNA polymerase sigma factor [Prevotella sp.]
MSEGVKDKRKVIERLFNDKYQQLFYYAYDLTNDEEVSKDFVNEAFVSLLEKMDELKEERLDGYLFVSIRNRCFSHLKKQRREDRYRDYCLTTFTEEDEDYWETMEDRIKKMNEEIEQMPERTQFILKQCYFEDHSYKEVANMLGITSDGVKHHIMKAFQKLRMLFNVK